MGEYGAFISVGTAIVSALLTGVFVAGRLTGRVKQLDEEHRKLQASVELAAPQLPKIAELVATLATLQSGVAELRTASHVASAKLDALVERAERLDQQLRDAPSRREIDDHKSDMNARLTAVEHDLDRTAKRTETLGGRLHELANNVSLIMGRLDLKPTRQHTNQDDTS